MPLVRLSVVKVVFNKNIYLNLTSTFRPTYSEFQNLNDLNDLISVKRQYVHLFTT